jgi:hypothetical protein
MRPCGNFAGICGSELRHNESCTSSLFVTNPPLPDEQPKFRLHFFGFPSACDVWRESIPGSVVARTTQGFSPYYQVNLSEMMTVNVLAPASRKP